MGYYVVEGARGDLHGFDIAGDKPDDWEMEQINIALGNAAPKPPPEPEPGAMTNIGHGLMRAWNKTQAGFDIGVGLAQQAMGDTEDAKAWIEAAKEQQAEAKTYKMRERPFYEEEGIGNVIANLLGTAAQSAPATVAAIGTAAAISNPITAVPAAVLAGATVSAPMLLSDNAERQIEEHGYIKDPGKALIGTAAQAGVEGVSDTFLGGLGGALTRVVPKEIIKRATEIGTKKAFTIAAKKIGVDAAAATMSEGAEEAVQQVIERWQAELPLDNPEAQQEYLESAITGAILGTAFGGTLGAHKAVVDYKDEKARKAVIEDEEAYAAALSGKKAASEKAWDQATQDKLTEIRLPEQKLLEDYSDLPPGLRPDEFIGPRKPKKADAQNGPGFSEVEYKEAATAMRGFEKFSLPRLQQVTKASPEKAKAIYDDMLRRGDAFPTGDQNQYASMTLPKKAIKVDAPPTKRVRSRDYTIKPTSKDAFTIKLGDRELKSRFSSREEAETFIKDHGLDNKNASISEDPKGKRYGVFEQQYEHVPGQTERLFSERKVNEFDSEEDAKVSLANMDPAFSPEANNFRGNLTDAQKTKAIADDIRETLTEPIAKRLGDIAGRVIGGDRVAVRVVPRINRAYLQANNIPHAGLDPNAVAEGFEFGDHENALRRVITLANDLHAPNITPQSREKLLNDVLNHELVHTMRSLDLLSKAEWNQLIHAATNTKVEGKPYTHFQQMAYRYRATPGRVMEESIAEMVRAYVKNPASIKDNQRRGILKKLADFIKKMMGLGQRHDATELLDTIFRGGIASRETGYGGLGARGPDDLFFSLVKPDNFFLNSYRAIEGAKIAEDRGQQWWKIVKSSGATEDEIDWLGLKEMLANNNEVIDKRDLLNHIAASSPKIETFIRSDDPSLQAAGQPKWKGMMQPGSGNVTEVAFTFTPKEGEPDYKSVSGHVTDDRYKVIKNYLAFARYKDVIEDNRKIMRIEEIQSDLHQDAKKAGGYYSKSAKDQLDLVEAEIKATRGKIADLKYNMPRLATKERILEFQEAYKETEALQERLRDLNSVRDKLEPQLYIPNAPFKNSWEDYVIKRLIRHAAENGYTHVAFHGEPESIRDTESYPGEIEVETDAKGKEKYFVNNQEWGGSRLNATSIFNRYLQKLPAVVRKLAQPFNATLEMREATDESMRRSGQWQEEPIDPLSNFDNDSTVDFHVPDLATLKKIRSKVKRKFRSEERRMGDDTALDAERIVQFLDDAVQVGINYRTFRANNVIDAVDGDYGRKMLKDAVAWANSPNYEVALGYWDEKPERHGFGYKHYILGINDRMKNAFGKGDVPMFSMAARGKDQPMYAAAAPMGQRVPLTTPPDRLAEIHRGMQDDVFSSILNKSLGWMAKTPFGKQKLEGAIDDTVIALQDRMLPLAKLVDRMKKNGAYLSNESDPMLRATLFPSQTDDHLIRNDKDYYKPLQKAVTDLGISEAEANDLRRLNGAQPFSDSYPDRNIMAAEMYLYALHAKERNAEMHERNLNIAQRTGTRTLEAIQGSGMTDQQADQILGHMAQQRYWNRLNSLTDPDSLRSRYRALIKDTNDVRVRYGLTPDFRTMVDENGLPLPVYEDYAPLRGHIGESMLLDDLAKEFARTGKGLNIRGKEDFAATGRRSLADSLIGTAVMQNQETVVRGHKNEVGQSLYRLAEEFAQQLQGTVDIMPAALTKYTVVNGSVRQVQDIMALNEPDIFKVKIDGQQKYLRIGDQRLARALSEPTNLGNTGIHAFLKTLAKTNRWLSMVRTSFSPEFVISNMIRDHLTARLNIKEHDVQGLGKSISRNVFPALRGVYRAIRSGDMTSPMAKAYLEFREMGGHSAYLGIHQLEDTIKRIQEEIAGTGSDENLLQKSWGKVKAVGDWMDDYNTAAENATRLATYIGVRDYFLSQTGDPTDPSNIRRAKELAAKVAKNITVNFDAGGRAKPITNALYLFYNASMQGSMAMLGPIVRSKKIRRMWGGIVMAGVMQDIVGALMSGDDDDGQKIYDKIPAHVLEHNMVFMDPFGITERGYFAIPMPYLFNAAWNLGRSTSRMARGGYDMGDYLSSAGMTMFDAVNPWGSANSFLNFVSPTIVDPFVDLALNNNFAGVPIQPTENPFDPNSEIASQRYWANTNPAYVSIADWMSRLSGREGDYIPGLVEVSPNVIEYWVNWIGGGAGTFAARTLGLVMGGPEELTANDIPFVRKIYGNVSSANDLQTYIEGRDEVLRVRKELKDAKDDGDSERYTRIMRDYPDEYKASVTINKIENARKKIASQIKKVRESTRLPEERKAEIIKQLKDKQNQLVGSGNKIMADLDL